MRTQTLREHSCRAETIVKAYPKKQWKLCSVQTICRRNDKTGSAVDWRAGSGRPKSAHTANTTMLKTRN